MYYSIGIFVTAALAIATLLPPQVVDAFCTRSGRAAAQRRPILIHSTTTTSLGTTTAAVRTSTSRQATSLGASGGDGKSSSSSIIPNPFKKLPWNVKKEQERQARRLQLERAALHRELGIAEDATYEEIVEATDGLIARAGDNLKRKIQIEVAKDKILQIRLSERLAGLQSSKEARAQSSYEVEGVDEDDVPKAAQEWNAPRWTQGLIVKPDEAHIRGQVRLWGIITAVGASFPPAQDYLGRFTWLVCVAQLTFRGMPKEDREGGGLGMSFNAGGGSGKGGHRKVAFALGISIWVSGIILVYGLMPTWAKAQRWTGTIAFAMQNLIFGLACSYLQPYKG